VAKEVRMRKCLVTGGVYSSPELIRFVCAPSGQITPDVAAKLPGRGCWVHADREALQKAIEKKLLMRFGNLAFSDKLQKGLDVPAVNNVVKASVPDDLLEQIENLLKRRCLEYLSLANRAGLLIIGFEKVRAALMSGKTDVLIVAKDGADNGRNKICQGLDNLKVFDMFCRDDLSKATGRENSVNIAVLPGGLRKSLLREMARYELSRKKVIN
jgi:predicted RNA-binding protein YlxR (DUF448 family)/ribosomal protein L30E